MKKQSLKLLASFLAGASMVLAFAPFGYWFIAPFSLLLLFYQWQNDTSLPAWRSGLAWGLGCFGFGLFWLRVSIDLFGNVSTPLAILAALSVALAMALFIALCGFIVQRLCKNLQPEWCLLLLPSIWVLIEWARHWAFGGFPWLTVGYSQIDSLLSAYAPLGGVLLVSFMTAASAALMAYLFSGRKRIIASVLLLSIWSMAALLSQYQWTQAAGAPLKVSLLQGNIEQALKWLPSQKRKTLDLYAGLTQHHWNSDLIIWPETAVPGFYHQLRDDFLLPLAADARQHHTQIVLGLPVKDPDNGHYYNAMLSLGGEPEFYFKRHLVPFGEYLPLKKLLQPLLQWMQIPMSDFAQPTASRPLMQLAGYPAGLSICYEDVFGSEIIQALPEAAFLINASNDGWFGNSLAPHQHLQMARMRALETGRYLIRSTNTGISAFIDEHGRIKVKAPQFEQLVLSSSIIPMHGLTPYARWGDLPLVWLLGLFIGWAGFTKLRRAK